MGEEDEDEPGFIHMRVVFLDAEEKARQRTVFRFKIFVKWLSTNPMAADEKAKTLELFDFDHFTIKDLASTVRKSGLYPSDKIIERMEQISEVKQRVFEIMKKARDNHMKGKERLIEQLKDLRQEKKEALSVKDQEINKLQKEKKLLLELNRKRKNGGPTPEGKLRKL